MVVSSSVTPPISPVRPVTAVVVEPDTTPNAIGLPSDAPLLVTPAVIVSRAAFGPETRDAPPTLMSKPPSARAVAVAPVSSESRSASWSRWSIRSLVSTLPSWAEAIALLVAAREDATALACSTRATRPLRWSEASASMAADWAWMESVRAFAVCST
ncbi:unannotated protein [freshwater metagenome]|uniref:Unannotated protein n=1 Tax=freshwater metagenome TaxID=449393 RepID=A0A6J6RQ17_9ZZZZ